MREGGCESQLGFFVETQRSVELLLCERFQFVYRPNMCKSHSSTAYCKQVHRVLFDSVA